MISKNFFKRTHLIIYLLFSSVFSIASVYYAIKTPFCYSLAILSGVVFLMFSYCLAFFAIFQVSKNNKKLVIIILSCLCGALTLGCRPTLFIGNLALIPLFYIGLKKQRIRIREMILCLLPYLIVVILLMVYNFLRFDNAFEFGQSYQITIADQSQYLKSGRKFDVDSIANF